MKKLYVGNLPFQVSEDQLQEWFAGAGFNPASVTIVRDRFSGQPRGFGFVEINDDQEADNAIASLNGKDLSGRAVVVNEARPQRERGGRGPGGGRRRREW